jgi:methyltransferase (TIGR00027 family)
MSIHVQLEGVEETLLIPLWARAEETRRPDALVRDPFAVEMVGRIAYDFSKFAGDHASQTGIAIRSAVLDDAAHAFLAAHPGAVVLNLAAGLDTRFSRVGAAAGRWYEVDLPNVMKLRRQLFEETDRHRFVAGSVLEPGWLEAVEAPAGTPVLVIVEGLLMYLSREEIAGLLASLAARFPGAEVLAELFGRLATGNTWWFRSVRRTRARFAGGIDDPHELEALAPAVRVREVWYLLDRHAARWGLFGLARWLPIFRNQYKIARLTLGAPAGAATPAAG